jgi:hypothetical protein
VKGRRKAAFLLVIRNCMELLLEHEELRAVLVKYWKDSGVPVPDASRLVVRCNHKTNTVRAVIVTDKERKYAR